MTLAFTGHRPGGLQLPAGISPYSNDVQEILESVANKVIDHTQATRVIWGGALGWDQAAAAAVMQRGDNLELIAALPFPGFDNRWPQDSKDRLRTLMMASDEVIWVNKTAGFNAAKMQQRNKWMVDNADRMASLYSGSGRGGTYNCLVYAHKQGVPVTSCWNAFRRRLELVEAGS